MLFQGQELGAAAPFLYFADHKASIAKEVRKGRRQFLAPARRRCFSDLAVDLEIVLHVSALFHHSLPAGVRATRVSHVGEPIPSFRIENRYVV